MATKQAAAKSPPFAKNSIIWEKKGPLPVWAWALIVLGLVLAVTMWRRNKAAATATEATTGELPGNQAAPPIFIVPQAPTPPVTVPITVTAPPTSGVPAPRRPRTDPTPAPAPPPATVPQAPPGAGRESVPAPPPVPTPVPGPTGTFVPVVKYTSKNPPWNSTLSGIWSHFKGQTTAANWQAIWNHPLNAQIRAKRGAADRIQPGDQIFVPGVR